MSGESMSDGAPPPPPAFSVGTTLPAGRTAERVSVKSGGRRRAARRDVVFARCAARVAESRASLLLAHRMGSEGKAALEQIVADEFMEESRQRASSVGAAGGSAAAANGPDAADSDEDDDLTHDERVEFLIELERALLASPELETNGAAQIWDEVCAAEEEETARAIQWYEANS